MSRRWTIWKWDDGQCGVKGPSIAPKEDGLVGMDWVRAAEVQVMPVDSPNVLSTEEARRILLALEGNGYSYTKLRVDGVVDRLADWAAEVGR